MTAPALLDRMRTPRRRWPPTDTGAPPAEVAALRWEDRLHRAAHPMAYPVLLDIARRWPVARVPGVGVVVSDAALGRDVLRSDAFTKNGPGAPSDLWTPVLGPSVLLNMEGPEHAELRRALSPLFTPRAVAQLADELLSRPLAELGRALRSTEPVDLNAAVGSMAGSAICHLTGVRAEPDAVARAFASAREIVGMVRLHRRSLAPRQVRRARAVMAELTDTAREAYRLGDERTVPGRMAALGLSEDAAAGAVGAFVLTGTETVVSVIPRMIALLAQTGWLTRLALLEPAAMTTERAHERVIEEALRVTVPSPAMLRSVVADTQIGGTDVRAGERVVVLTLACVRPDRFDPTGEIPAHERHLWFGAGPHFCLGMPLAIAQMRAALETVVDAVATTGPLRIDERRPARGVLIPAYASMTVRLLEMDLED